MHLLPATVAALVDAPALRAVIEGLESEPRPPSARELRTGRSWLRLRHGVHRVLYRVDAEARRVTVVAIATRGASYLRR